MSEGPVTVVPVAGVPVTGVPTTGGPETGSPEAVGPSDSPAFDWPGLMRAGLRHLGLSPTDFWALSPVELMLKLGMESGPAVMARSRLEELARAYPDGSDRPRRQGETDE